MKQMRRFIALMLVVMSIFSTYGLNVLANSTSKALEQNEADSGAEEAQQEETDSKDSGEKQEVSSVIEYVYIESTTLYTPDTQNIVIGLTEDIVNIESAELMYQNDTTGESHAACANNIIDSAILFSIGFDNESESGLYTITGFTYTIQGQVYSIQFDSTDQSNCRFGVNEEYSGVIDASDDISIDDIELEIITLDEEGNTTSANSIEEAIAEMQDKVESTETTSIADGIALRSAKSSNVVVVLDPGHDETHSGAYGNGLYEHILTLKIAQYCKAELEEYNGAAVYMTRTTNACAYGGSIVDTGTCTANRVVYANSVGADVLVSIHLNSSTSTSANGAEVYYPNSNYNSTVGSEGKALAQAIEDKLVALGLNNRGITIRNSEDNTLYPNDSLADYYSIIRRSKLCGFPGIIVEHAFLSNSSDAAYLKSESNLKALGVADATGIANYYGLSKGVTDEQKVQIQAFVTRLYTTLLGRDPDTTGLNNWVTLLANGTKTGAQVVDGFLKSNEFTGKKYSNADYVERLYKTMLNRSSDSAGKADWVTKLEVGMSREGVSIGFINSSEFTAVCSSYGITRGSLTVTENRDLNYKYTRFVSHLYTNGLGRTYDVSGLNMWTGLLVKGTKTPVQVAEGFIFSNEFLGKNYSDTDYVKVLYTAFLGRTYDSGGLNFWLTKMANGMTRKQVMNSFAESTEFKALIK